MLNLANDMIFGSVNMKKLLFAAFACLILLLSLGATIYSMETGFEIDPIDETRQQQLLKNNGFHLLTKEPEKEVVDCFDVNQEGIVAVGWNKSGVCTSVVYDRSGNYLFGVRLEAEGDLGLEFTNNSLNVYTVRSDYIYSIRMDGTLESVAEVKNNAYNSTYYNRRCTASARTLGDTKYELKKQSFLSSGYSKIIIANDGAETVFYEVTGQKAFSSNLFSIAWIAIFVLAIVILIVKIIIPLRKNKHIN